MIRMIVNEALAALAGDFSALCSRMGRPSIAPEKLLRAMLLQAFYSIRTERQLMERLEFDLLFRWFVGIGVDDAAWDHSTFSKNRDRLLEGDIAAKLSRAVLAQPRIKQLLSTDHFSVDGMKSFNRMATNRRPMQAAGTGRRIFTARSDRTTRTPLFDIEREINGLSVEMRLAAPSGRCAAWPWAGSRGCLLVQNAGRNGRP